MVSLRHVTQSRPQTPAKLHRLVVPVTGTAADPRLIEVVGQLFHKDSVNVTLVYVVEVQQSMPLDAELPLEIERGEHVLNAAERAAHQNLNHKSGAIQTELLQARSAGAAIVDEAIDRNADAIVMAAHCRRKFGCLTLGETVDYVLKNAPCEVIVVRQPLDEWADGDDR